jgi:hypothetical protein
MTAATREVWRWCSVPLAIITLILALIARKEAKMPHAIIRGANGRRHEVDFGDGPVRVEIYSSEETVEIFIEADFEILPEERRRFVVLNIPRHLLSAAAAAAARRAANSRPAPSTA